MPSNWKYFRDEIVINQEFSDFVHTSISGLPTGSTLLIAARTCQHEPGYAFRVDAGFNLNLVVDSYDAKGGLIDVSGVNASSQGTRGGPGQNSRDSDPGGTGDDGGAGPAGTDAAALNLFARSLANPHVVANGGSGGKGGTGGSGGGPGKYKDPDQRGGWGVSGPGRGGPGGPGGAGGAGGRVAIAYVTATAALPPAPIQNNGGPGGGGGDGGVGAMALTGKSKAPNGAIGRRGAAGPAGHSTLPKLTETDYWTAVVSAIGTDAAEWAKYRVRVGEYFFRGFRAIPPYDTWRGLALDEFAAALALNPGMAQAQTNLTHIVYNRNILGIARDVDIFPDFDRYDTFVTTSAQLIGSLLSFASGDLNTSVLSGNTRQSLQAEINHLQSSAGILTKEEQAAAIDNQIAGQEKTDADQKVADLAKQVQAAKEALDNASINFAGIIGIIGKVATVVMAFPTGGASLLSFAPDIVAVTNDLEGGKPDPTGLSSLLPDSVTDFVKTLLHQPVETADQKAQGKGLGSLAKDAGNLKTLIQQNYAEVNNLINLGQSIADLGQATSAQQAAYKALLAQSMEAVHAQMLAGLRNSQTEILHEVAVEKIAQLAADLQTAQAQLVSVTKATEDMVTAAQAIIEGSHGFFDILARFAFYAARALEIYTLDDLSSEIRFDYGHVHPDVDEDYAVQRLSGAQYSAKYQEAWRSIPAVMNYRQRYLDYFLNSPTDLTRDIYIQSLTDPAVLNAFNQQRKIEVIVDLADPALAGRAEAKVEAVGVSLIGARGLGDFFHCRVEHNGTCSERKIDRTVVTQYLRPHQTVVQTKASPLAPTDLILDQKTDPLTAPRSIAFWGRGIAAKWRLIIDDPNIDLSGLTEVQIGIGYVAFLA